MVNRTPQETWEKLKSFFSHILYESKNSDSSWTMSIMLPSCDGGFRRHNICRGPRKVTTAEKAFQLIVKRSTVIKPLQKYLCDGEVPDFIRFKIPCPHNPRKYVILSCTETGPLYEDTVNDLLNSFMDSANEDLFFDRDTYNVNEKMNVITLARKKNLLVRHFGELPGVADRYVCVYKKKTSYEIFHEINRWQGLHHKYQIIINRYPNPR